MKSKTSTRRKICSILFCLAPILTVATISQTAAFDLFSRDSEVNFEKRPPVHLRSDAGSLTDLELLPINVDGAEVGVGEHVEKRFDLDVDLQNNLIEKDWLFRFSNPVRYGDKSIDCHVAEDKIDAVKDLRLAMQASSSEASIIQFKLARILKVSRGADCQRIAFELFQQSAVSGYARAYAELANAYKKGLGVRPSFALALKNFEQAARLGLANSAYRLIELTERGNEEFPGDPKKASEFLNIFLPLLEGKIRQGDAVAARSLARLYNNGNLLQLDADKAIRFMRFAANLGDAIAMHDLALLLMKYQRDQLERDDIYPLLIESSRLGYSAAFTAIGRLHLKGEFGFRQSDAARWFQSGVDAGHPGAMAELAELYLEGRLVTRDVKIAKDLALQGSRLNHLGSKRILQEIRDYEKENLVEG